MIQQLTFNQDDHVAISILMNERGILINAIYYLTA